MKTRIPALIAGLALGGSMLLATGGVVAAAGQPSNAGPSGKGVCVIQATAARTTGATLGALQAFGDCEIGRRFQTLTDLSAKVSGSKVMTSSHKSALSAEISSTVAGLTSLKATIDAETSMTKLRAEIVEIATNFRVYLLVVPQVNLVNAADGVVASQAHFATVNTNLQNRINAEKAAGKDVSAAQKDLDAMNASVTAAVGLASPVPASLLPITPAQYNAGPGATAISSARTALGQARDDLKSAVASAQACRDALK